MLLLAGCAHQTPADRVIPRTTVLQGGAPMRPETVEGNRAKYKVTTPFVLRVRNKTPNASPTAVQICASPDRAIFDQVRRGLMTAQVPCYRPGTGMATSRGGDDPRGMELFLSSGDGHNYYTVDRRIDQGDHVDIFVAGIRGLSAENLSSGTVYAIVFIDDNQNRVIEDTEYELLELVIGR
jgi:hypothetical protein